MIKYAILGYGVVGSGVAEVMEEQKEKIAAAAGEDVALGYILVRHDYPGDPYADKLVTDFSVIENDPEIRIVAEVIGGVGAAYEYSKRALMAGKSVVSSNKELVATHGDELCALARENGVNYLFEGSVGGGIPVLRPLVQCLAANRIDEVFGILNGTTNYILTAMDTQGKSFAEALKTAQELGYAEADPTMWRASTPAARPRSWPTFPSAALWTPPRSPHRASQKSPQRIWSLQAPWAIPSSSSDAPSARKTAAAPLWSRI